MPAGPFLATALFLAATQGAPGQQLAWEDREYGIGVVVYPALVRGAAVRGVIRAAPERRAAIVARLAGDSLCFERPRSCSRLSERMIEYDYEIAGWPVLRYAADSGWAEVSLGAAQRNAPTGWVQLNVDSITVLRWDTALARHDLFFLHPQDAAFYRQPDERTRVTRQLARKEGSERYDYIMHAIAARGPWLQVALESPSYQCDQPPARPPRQDTLWIRYLTPALRPRVFYFTRGC